MTVATVTILHARKHNVLDLLTDQAMIGQMIKARRKTRTNGVIALSKEGFS